MKYFKLGEYIWVIDGRYAGERGIITLASDHSITFFSEIWKKEYTVNVYDVQMSTECSDLNIQSKSNEFKAFMKVKLIDKKCVGILLEVEWETAKVLLDNGDVKWIQLSEIA